MAETTVEMKMTVADMTDVLDVLEVADVANVANVTAETAVNPALPAGIAAPASGFVASFAPHNKWFLIEVFCIH
jgi:hypothetical protein